MVADADPVGLELLVARIAAQLHQPVARHRAADRDRAALHRGIDRGIHHDAALPLALGGVAFGEVAKLVGHRGGELGLVVHQGQQAARHENVAARQGVSVGHRLVEDEEAIAAGHAGLAHQPLPDPVDEGLELGCGIGRPDRLLDVARQRIAALGDGGGGLRGNAAGRAAAGQHGQHQKSDKTAKNHYSSTTPATRLCARAPHKQMLARLEWKRLLWHS